MIGRHLGLFAGLAAIVLLSLLAPAPARAAGSYTATAPTKGALYRDGQGDRYLLGGQWLFRADPGNVGTQDGWWRSVSDTTGWSPVSVPNSYNARDLSPTSMSGSVGWYRRDFVLPSRAFSKTVPKRFRSWIIRFESINYTATVWLNGRRIGHHRGAYLPFEFKLKGWHAGVNRLVVRVDDHRSGTDLPPGPSGGWWNFGGIQREVYLRSVQRADIYQAQVRPILPCPTCTARIQEQVTVNNPTGSAQPVALRGFYGSRRLNFGVHVIRAGKTWTAKASVRLPHPHLWSIDDPHLYKATLKLTDPKGRALEGYTTYSGVRKIAVTPSGQLQLNGRSLNVRGVNLHEQNAATGAALSTTQLQNLMGWARDLGSTIIRAHYPLNPQLEEMADRDGVLLWSEVPVYQVASGNLGKSAFVNQARTYLRQNILVNQNHPSILLWSIGNELTNPPNAPVKTYMAWAAKLVRQLDPTRPVGMAVVTWPGVGCQSAYAPLDVIGFNDYLGWFDEGGGTTADRDQLGPFLDFLHSCYPNKALMVTEFGFEANRNGPVEEKGTYQFQASMTQYHLGVFATKPYISGAIWFALQDFAARPGWTGGNPIGDPPWVEKGAIGVFGNVKPIFGTLQAAFRSTVQIAPRS